jgi:hypothetical protein
MRRRVFLSTAIVLSSGCIGAQKTKNKDGIKFTACGASETTDCSEENISTKLTNIDGKDVLNPDGDLVAVVRSNSNNITINGRVTSIQKSKCRELKIQSFERKEGMLDIILKNKTPQGFSGSCPEIRAETYYKLIIDKKVNDHTIRLVHILNNGDKELNSTVKL